MYRRTHPTRSSRTTPRLQGSSCITLATALLLLVASASGCGGNDPSSPVEQKSPADFGVEMHEPAQDMGNAGATWDMSAPSQDMSSQGWEDFGAGAQDMASLPGLEPWEAIELSTTALRFAHARPGTVQERFIQVKNLSQYQPFTLSRFDLLSTSTEDLTAEQQRSLAQRLDVSWQTSDARIPGDTDYTIEPGELLLVHIVYKSEETDAFQGSEELPRLDWELVPELEIKISLEEEGPCLTLAGVHGALGPRRAGLALNLGEVDPYEPSVHRLEATNCSPSTPLTIKDIFISRNPHDALQLQSGEMNTMMGDQSIQVAPGEAHAITIEVSPLLDIMGTGASLLPYLGQLTLLSNALDFERSTLELFAREESANECPPFELAAFAEDGSALAIATEPDPRPLMSEPLRQLSFVADYNHALEGPGSSPTLTWSLVTRPETSTAALFQEMAPIMEGSDVPDPMSLIEERELFFDVPGEYVVEVRASSTTERAVPSPACMERRLTFEVRPTQDIYISTTWETPLDTNLDDRKGADLDLHYIHPEGEFEDAFYDIFWRNRTADWGAPGPQGDPNLLRDDRDGAGPEVLAHQGPIDGLSYDVGVYYFDDAGFYESLVTTSIYIRGQLTATSRQKALQATGQYLHVGKVHWSSSQPYVQLIEQVVSPPP